MTDAMRQTPAHDRVGLTTFALAIYSEETVRASCLVLQEDMAADVNIVLWAAWLSRICGVPVDRGRAIAARDLVLEWHEEVVKSLRALRTHLKGKRFLAFSAKAASFREAVKKTEIDAELIELEALETFANAQDWPASEIDVGSVQRSIAAAAGLTDEDEANERSRTAIAILASASMAFPQQAGKE